MFTCPSCGNTLASTAETCQFCGADVSYVPREPEGPQPNLGHNLSPGTLMTAYYLLGMFWLLTALFGLAEIYYVRPYLYGEPIQTGPFSIALILGMVLRGIVATGFLMRVRLFLNIVNILATLGIAWGLYKMALDIAALNFTGSAIFWLLSDLFDVVVNVGVIWLMAKVDELPQLPFPGSFK